MASGNLSPCRPVALQQGKAITGKSIPGRREADRRDPRKTRDWQTRDWQTRPPTVCVPMRPIGTTNKPMKLLYTKKAKNSGKGGGAKSVGVGYFISTPIYTPMPTPLKSLILSGVTTVGWRWWRYFTILLYYERVSSLWISSFCSHNMVFVRKVHPPPALVLLC
jgi:hypothetical protein